MLVENRNNEIISKSDFLSMVNDFFDLFFEFVRFKTSKSTSGAIFRYVLQICNSN